MSIIFVGWGRFFDAQGNKITVPAPPDAPYLWDFLASQSKALADVGFTDIQLPPASKAQGGNGAGCDGYGVYHRRDLGVFEQQGSVETRYGTKERLQRLVGVAHANGLGIYLDVVLHQLMGENGGPGVFNYPASVKGVLGRGSTKPGWFRGGTGNDDPIPPFCPEDDVPEQPDFSFGRETVRQRSDPARVVVEDDLDYVAWLFATTDADHCRLDDTKGMYSPAILELVKSPALKGRNIYAEFFVGDIPTLRWYTADLSDDLIGVEDFPIHWALQNACDGFTAWGLDGCGFSSVNPSLSYGFADSPDSDSSYQQQIVSCKLLAYAYLLSIETNPLIYGKDFYGSDVWPGAYGLGKWISTMVWVNRTLANGPTTTRFNDDKVIVLERTGTPGLLTGINFDTYNIRTITCQVHWEPGTQLHDYGGLSPDPDIWVQGDGTVTFRIPCNAYASGQSYVFYGPAGLSAPIRTTGRSTTQVFAGSPDLDIPPATTGSLKVGRIWCAAHTNIHTELKCDYEAPATIATVIVDPDGLTVIGADLAQSGWYTLYLDGHGLPDEGVSFELSVTYTATQTLEAA